MKGENSHSRLSEKAHFTNKIIQTDAGNLAITKVEETDIEFYLIPNGYVEEMLTRTNRPGL